MGMRLPGGCHDSETFWDLLMNKREGMIPIPASRWNQGGFLDPHGGPGTIKTEEGNFLGSVDPAAFDAGFFSITAAQVGKVDPQQRILLEVVQESLENAGEKDVRGKNIGVYVGTFAEVSRIASRRFWLTNDRTGWKCMPKIPNPTPF